MAAMLRLVGPSLLAVAVLTGAPRGQTRQDAVRLALAYLERQQNADGSWNAPKETEQVGVTALALLAFLADKNKHEKVVSSAAGWLLEQQARSSGLIGQRAGASTHYGHAIATLALAEVAARSKVEAHRVAAQRAVDYIEAARNPYKTWRYRPRDGDNDSSVTGWMTLALLAAKRRGFAVDGDALKYARAWFEEVTDPNTGHVGYMRRGEPSARSIAQAEKFPPERTEALTALGLAVRLNLGDTVAKHPVLARSADRLRTNPPRWDDDGSIDFVYWLHGSDAAARLGGRRLTEWSSSLVPALLHHQERTGDLAGSWPARGVWGDHGGRVYATAMATRSLLVLGPTATTAAAGRRRSPAAKTIGAGLKWLADHQKPDGRWSAPNTANDIGVTGLALLAFLGDGSTLRSGPYKSHIKKAVVWLKEQQSEQGLFGTESGRSFMYNHAIGTLAFVEAYGLSKYKTMKRYAQRAVDYIQRARNPYKVWRYSPRDGDNDTSVTGWMVFALKSAKDFGLDVKADAFRYALAWLDEVTDPKTGRCGYTKRGEPSSREVGTARVFPPSKTEALTATGLMCRIFLGQTPETHPVLLAAGDTISKKPPTWNPVDGSIDLYYWYYGSYAMFQLGGRYWKSWKTHMLQALVKSQRSEKGSADSGSWDPVGAWGRQGGRAYSTALGVLCLEVYYRYTRLIR